MNRSRIVSKLLRNAFLYRWLKHTGRPHSLQAISLEITHRCICHCRMCNIWKIPQKVPDLPLSVWTDLLSSSEVRGLYELDITGGEPFLREDLRELLKWISRSKPKSFPQLKTLAVTTNGILTDRILDTVAEVVGPLQKQGVDLVLACGMDAVGEVHDKVRDFIGAWNKLNATFAGLRQLRAQHSNLIVGIKTTIVPDNVDELDKIADFAKESDFFTIISPCILTANRFGNMDLKDDLEFTEDQRQAIIRFYQSPLFAWNIHRQSMLSFYKSGRVKKPCSAGFNTVFVRHTGEVFPCPLISQVLGNIKDSEMVQMLSSHPAAQFRKKIGSFPECKVCTEPGLERIAWPFEGSTCLRRLCQVGFRDFEKLSKHMGLNKYLE